MLIETSVLAVNKGVAFGTTSGKLGSSTSGFFTMPLSGPD